VRAAGAVCLADEVQVGFGRVGEHYWAFQKQNVVPDIVTMGKPIANGHPMGAVVTRPEIARAFVTGMEYFNTFAGNPVSCAIASEVLNVVHDEGLLAHAEDVGRLMLDGMREIQTRRRLIGDVRGYGLFLGAELVLDRETLQPATAQAREVIEKLKQQHILLSTDGPYDNVLKIKPPMVFSQDNAIEFLEKLDRSLAQIEAI